MLHCLVLTPTDETLPVRCERDAGNAVNVTHEAIDELPRLDIPEAHDSVAVSHGNQGPVGRDGDR
jgi:hypothetical protein